MHQMKRYELAMKHAKKFAAKSGSPRPTLVGALLAEDGSVIATDAHRLMVVKDAHTAPEPTIIHVKNVEPIDGQYPDVSRIIPTEHKTTAYIDAESIAHCLTVAKAAEQIAKITDKKVPLVRVNVDADGITLTQYEPPVFSATLPADNVEGDYLVAGINATYLVDAFGLLKDFGVRGADIGFNGNHGPITLTAEDDGVMALVLPVRLG